MHVLIDLWDCDADLIADQKTIRRLLKDWVKAMGMEPLGNPVLHELNYYQTKDPGITGFQVITESHLSIHTFTATGVCWVDLFSCKDFDADALVRTVREGLGANLAEYQSINRGFNVTRPRGLAPWFEVRKPQEE